MAGRKKSTIDLKECAVDFTDVLNTFIDLYITAEKKPNNKSSRNEAIKELLLIGDTKNYESEGHFKKLSRQSFDRLKKKSDDLLKVCDEKKKKAVRSQFLEVKLKLEKKFDLLGQEQKPTGTTAIHTKLMTFFHNTVWSCYERQETCIGKKQIHFCKKNGQELEVVVCPAQKDVGEWKGTARLDKQNKYLLATLYHSMANSAYTHFMIKVDGMITQMEICIGHMTFEHPSHNNVVSKTVILQLEKEKVPAEQKVLCGETFALDSQQVNKYIRQFFLDRSRNRLSSPHSRTSNIFTLEALREWHEVNIESMYGNLETHDDLQGSYLLAYHKRKDKKLVMISDTLDITSDHHPELFARYEHEVEEGVLQRCEGKVLVSHESKTMSIYLDAPVVTTGRKEKINYEPLFIMVSIPAKGTKWNILSGVIAGNRDRHKGPVGRLVLMIKLKSKEKITEEYKGLLKKFLLKMEPQSFAGSPNIYNFNMLRKMMD